MNTRRLYQRMTPQPHALLFAFVLLTQLACSTEEAAPETRAPNDDQTTLMISVMDSVSGEPIRGATIRTDPPSSEVVTGITGELTMKLAQTGGDPIRVIASHPAYLDAQTQITPLAGTETVVDFALQSSAVGLHASATTLQFAETESRKSLRLSSNVQNTGFFTLVTDPWVSVTPSQGVIVNRETAVLQVMIDRASMPDQLPAQSELVINSDNGTRELVITLVIDGSAAAVEVNDRQKDCRIPEVFRVGRGNPGYPLVQFLPSVVLPEGAGPRGINTVGNPFLVDSVVITELGELTITHRDGGPLDTTLVLFELDSDEKLVELTSSTGVSFLNRRASITDWALTRGVYCYYLSGTDVDFDQAYNIVMDIGFTPAR